MGTVALRFFRAATARAQLGLVIVFCFYSASRGAFTPITPPPGEPDIRSLLGTEFGGNFTTSGVNFIGGGPAGNITATRLHDSDFPGVVSATYSPAAPIEDRLFAFDGIVAVKGIAGFTGNGVTVGHVPGTSGATSAFDDIISLGGLSYHSGPEVLESISGTFRWGLRVGNNLSGFTSNPNDNSGRDAMVLYVISGGDITAPTFFFCFSDGFFGDGTGSYNDGVFKVTVPEPSHFALILAATAMAVRRRRCS